MVEIVITIFSLIILLFSVVIHEVSHGSVAYLLGDPTAKVEGRLTLNPLKHLDPFGSVILPLLLLLATAGQGPVFGWAKPVPINPYNLKDQRWGPLIVSMAGPLSNIVLAIFFGIFLRIIPPDFFNAFPGILIIFSFIVHINIILAIFNLVPIPPLDGSWILFKFIPQRFESLKVLIQQYGVFILIFLIFSGGLQFLGGITELIFHFITGI